MKQGRKPKNKSASQTSPHKTHLSGAKRTVPKINNFHETRQLLDTSGMLDPHPLHDNIVPISSSPGEQCLARFT